MSLFETNTSQFEKPSIHFKTYGIKTNAINFILRQKWLNYLLWLFVTREGLMSIGTFVQNSRIVPLSLWQ